MNDYSNISPVNKLLDSATRMTSVTIVCLFVCRKLVSYISALKARPTYSCKLFTVKVKIKDRNKAAKSFFTASSFLLQLRSLYTAMSPM